VGKDWSCIKTLKIFLVVLTAKHGGGILSKHWLFSRAEKAAIKFKQENPCTCGCCDIVLLREYPYLPEYSIFLPEYFLCKNGRDNI
jgi:hypothetical protein